MDHLGWHMTQAFIRKLQRLQLDFDVDQYIFPGQAAPNAEPRAADSFGD